MIYVNFESKQTCHEQLSHCPKLLRYHILSNLLVINIYLSILTIHSFCLPVFYDLNVIVKQT